MIAWLDLHSGVIGIFITIGTSWFLAWKYLDQRAAENRDKRFVFYHDLIKQLFDPEPGKVMKLDRQIAVTYELRNFPEYREVTIRILRGTREVWKTVPGVQRLIEEIDLTLAFLEAY